MASINDVLDKWRSDGPATWAEGPMGWIDLDGRPVQLTPWQRAALDAWWTHRYDVTTFADSNIKKTGKTFVNAVLTAWRWLALPGLHFAAGNDLDQSQGRQFSEIAEMIKRHPILSRHVTVNKSRLVYDATGSTLEALAADATGNAGANHLTSSHTEAWGILYEAGIAAYEELTPPPGRFYDLPCLRIVDSYAGFEGLSETWHDLVDRGLTGDRVDPDWPIYKQGGLLLFHIEGQEAQERCFRGTPQDRAVYYQDQRGTLRAGTFSRLHENKRTAAEGSFIDQDAWLALVDPDLLPLQPGSRISLWLGLDVAVRPGGDDCALVGLYPDDDKIKVGLHCVWKGGKERTRDLQLTGEVQAFILRLAKNYNIVGLAADPWQALQLCQNLAARGINVQLVNQNKGEHGRAVCDSVLYDLARNKQLVLYDHPDLRDAAAGAAAEELANGLIYIKKAARSKIDTLIAMSNALAASVFGVQHDEIVDRTVTIGPGY